jgi:hypothetical protein
MLTLDSNYSKSLPVFGIKDRGTLKSIEKGASSVLPRSPGIHFLVLYWGSKSISLIVKGCDYYKRCGKLTSYPSPSESSLTRAFVTVARFGERDE